MLQNAVLYVLLRAVSVMLPYIPVRVLHALAAMAGFCMYYLAAEQRSGLASNLATALNRPPESPTVQNLVREAFQTNAQNWVDTVRIATLQASLDHVVEVEGWENLAEAAAPGKGVVMVTLHLGNFDLVGQALTRRYHLTVPVERVRPPQFFEFLLERRRALGINTIPADRAPRRMVEALRRGEMVGLAADGRVGGRMVDVILFGRSTRIPRSPVQLALHTGAALVVGVGVRERGGSYRGFITPRIPVPSSGSRNELEHEYAQRLAFVLEHFIDRFPGQWMAFTPLWREPVAPNQVRVAV